MSQPRLKKEVGWLDRLLDRVLMDRLVDMLLDRLVDTWTGWWTGLLDTGWLGQLGNHSVLRFQAGFRSVQSHSQT